MERELPTGRAVNELEIVARERAREFAIRTTSGPTPFLYRCRFSPERGGTVVHLDAHVELQGLGAGLTMIERHYGHSPATDVSVPPRCSTHSPHEAAAAAWTFRGRRDGHP